MELAFDTMSIRSLCENESQASLELGASVAEALRRRLADMRAAKSPKDLLVGRPRISADGQHMVIDLCDGQRVVFKANHPGNPKTAADGLDWARVSRIKILRIEIDNA